MVSHKLEREGRGGDGSYNDARKTTKQTKGVREQHTTVACCVEASELAKELPMMNPATKLQVEAELALNTC